MIQNAYLEIVSWATLRHPNLLPFMNVCQAKLSGGETLGKYCTVSPYMGEGTLRSRYAAAASNVNEAPSDSTPFDLSDRMRHVSVYF